LSARRVRGALIVATIAVTAAAAGGCGSDASQHLSVWSERSLDGPVQRSLRHAGIEASIQRGDSGALLERASLGRAPRPDVVVVATFSPAPFDPARARPARILASDALVAVVRADTAVNPSFVLRPRTVAIARGGTLLGSKTRLALASDVDRTRRRVRSVSGAGPAVVAAVLARRAVAGVVFRSTLRSLPRGTRARLAVVPIDALRSRKLLVTAAVSRSATASRAEAARRWLRADGTAADLRAAGLDAPYREP
jgi:hypothetical protein